jgi:hypothetical protein
MSSTQESAAAEQRLEGGEAGARGRVLAGAEGEAGLDLKRHETRLPGQHGTLGVHEEAADLQWRAGHADGEEPVLMRQPVDAQALFEPKPVRFEQCPQFSTKPGLVGLLPVEQIDPPAHRLVLVVRVAREDRGRERHLLERGQQCLRRLVVQVEPACQSPPGSRLALIVRPSGRLDEAVDDPLRAGLVEGDLELVAVDRGHPAIAELLVEDAVADAEAAAGPGRRRQDLGLALDQLAELGAPAPEPGDARLGEELVREGVGIRRMAGLRCRCSIWSSGNSAMKREGTDDIHWL